MKQTKDTTLQNYSVTATDLQYNIWLRSPFGITYYQPGDGCTKAELHAFKSNVTLLAVIQQPRGIQVFFGFILQTKRRQVWVT